MSGDLDESLQVAPLAMNGVCRRLQARGSLVIEFDHPSKGWHKWWEPAGMGPGDVKVSWWPAGQRGNSFCGRGMTTPLTDLPAVLAEIEERTRPRWGALDDLVWRRRRQWEHLDGVRRFIEAMASLAGTHYEEADRG